MEITIFTAMEQFFTNFLQGIHQTSPFEWIAVCCSICYLLLAIKESIYCWMFAFISSSIYVYIAYSVQLHLDALLQLFYVAMAVVGFVNWNKQKEDKKIKVEDTEYDAQFIDLLSKIKVVLKDKIKNLAEFGDFYVG
ncbi:MAG TPA: nicotinamide riboside transporter PnuC, partial [Taishania sp.]|nr:nicotinamide riboside transporter PnuC [Taishania sp.]